MFLIMVSVGPHPFKALCKYDDVDGNHKEKHVWLSHDGCNKTVRQLALHICKNELKHLGVVSVVLFAKELSNEEAALLFMRPL
jgi:hypothetical protein